MRVTNATTVKQFLLHTRQQKTITQEYYYVRIRDEGVKLSVFLLNDISHFQINLTDIVFTINVDFASLKVLLR